MVKRKFVILLFILLIIYLFSSGNTKISNKENYIILTSEDLTESAKLFYNLRKSDYDVSIVTIEEIGSSKPPDIREYLKDHFSSGYLLIIGSEDKIPRPNMYPSSLNHSISHTLPGLTETDFYYSLLKEDIDKDKDGFPGELFDDRMSIAPDLIVGRIPFDDNVIVKKVFDNEVNFLKNPLQKAVLASSFISFPGEVYQGIKIFNGDGARFSELLKSIVPCKIFTLYEKNGSFPSFYDCDLPLNKENFYEAIKGAGFVSWDAHGSSSSAFNEWWEDKNNNGIPDDGFKFQPFISREDQFAGVGIFFSGSCLNENGKDNLGKAALLKGGTIFIGSTEISFTPSYFSSPDDGGIASIEYYFAKNLARGETVGNSLYSAFQYYFNNLLWKDIEDPVEGSLMNIYDLNIYGDPVIKWELRASNEERPLANVALLDIPIAFVGEKNFEVKVNFDKESNAFFIFPRHDFYIESVSHSGAIIDNEFGIVRVNEAKGEVIIKGKVRGFISGAIKVKTEEGEASLNISVSGFNLKDVNFDGNVDANDFKSIVSSFGKTYMDEGFNGFCDLNFDYRVNGIDVLKFLFGD